MGPRVRGLGLAGRRVLLTGGSRGIGEHLADQLTGRGARLTVVARPSEQLDRVADRCGATAWPCDLSDPDAVADLAARLVRRDHTPEILVNNAAVEMIGDFAAQPPEALAAAAQLNLGSPMALTRAALPAMLDAGRGAIVNVSSLAGVSPLPGMTVYAATKAGLSQLSAGLRSELRGSGVTVTLVQLGPVGTDMLGRVDAHQPTAAAFRRAFRLRLFTDLSPSVVAARICDAVEEGRRHVRLPRRAAPMAMLGEVPRRAAELMTRGIDPRAAP